MGISKWQSDSQFCENYYCSGQKNGQKQSQNSQALALSVSFPIRVYLRIAEKPANRRRDFQKIWSATFFYPLTEPYFKSSKMTQSIYNHKKITDSRGGKDTQFFTNSDVTLFSCKLNHMFPIIRGQSRIQSTVGCTSHLE